MNYVTIQHFLTMTRTIFTFNKMSCPVLKALLLVSAIMTLAISCGKDESIPSEYRGKIESGEEADIGLSVIWSGYNLLSEGTSDAGGYIAWGESEVKDSYLKENYRFYNAEDGTYAIEVGSVWEDDPAATLWGDGWRIPSDAEMEELCDIEKCSVTYARYKGVKGWVVTSKVPGFEGKSIFFPAAGYKAGENTNYRGEQGVYWTSTLVEGSNARAVNLFFEHNTAKMNKPGKGVGGTIWCGYPIRPVKNRE